MGRGCVCVLLAAMVALAFGTDQLDSDYQMALIPFSQLTEESAPQPGELTGHMAVGVDPASLVKGPKVNAGFAQGLAQPETPKRIEVDCPGGRVVNNKCVKTFPKKARLATSEDNMQSPEQASDLSFEPDVHLFVKKHFGQDVMRDTDPEDHHAGFPGAEVVGDAMNVQGNSNADAAAEWLIPLGTGMMMNGDFEKDVSIGQTMSSAAIHPNKYAPHHLDVAEEASLEDGPTSVSTIAVASRDGSVSSSSPGNTPLTLSRDSVEIAEPGQPSVDVADEVEDIQEAIPQDPVAEEEGLPDTPTPTPTPDPAVIAAQQAAEQAKADAIESCLAMLESENIQCSGTPSEAQAMAETTSPSPVDQEPTVESQPEPEDPKTQLLKLIGECTSKAAAEFVTTTDNSSDFSDTLAKYSSALSCLASEDDVSLCVPASAMDSIEAGGDLSCF